MKSEHVDLSNLPDEPNLQDYENKPVQNYGMSLLRGMGFSQARGIGKRKQNQLADIYVLKPRPKGLGLGAQLPQQQNKQIFQIGDKIKIIQQPHRGLFGIVNQKNDEQTFSIQLYPSKSIVKVSKKAMKSISKSQMKKLQQQLNKQKNQQKQRKRLKWVTPQIRIKVIDPKSEFYLKKLIVTDLISHKQFVCRQQSQNGKTVTNLTEKDIQTVVPKNGGIVIIVKGNHKGQKATLIDRKKSKGSVTVQTLQQLQIIKLQQDDVSQYIQL